MLKYFFPNEICEKGNEAVKSVIFMIIKTSNLITGLKIAIIGLNPAVKKITNDKNKTIIQIGTKKILLKGEIIEVSSKNIAETGKTHKS